MINTDIFYMPLFCASSSWYLLRIYAGFPLTMLKRSKFTASELRESRFSPVDLYKEGFPHSEIIETDFTLEELLQLKEFLLEETLM